MRIRERTLKNNFAKDSYQTFVPVNIQRIFSFDYFRRLQRDMRSNDSRNESIVRRNDGRSTYFWSRIEALTRGIKD